MPQQSLLPDHPAMTALRVDIRSWPRTAQPDTVEVTTAVAIGSEPLKARSVVALVGLQRDYLDTLVETAVSTFMYGERPKDVARAIADVHRLARLHAQQHEF